MHDPDKNIELNFVPGSVFPFTEGAASPVAVSSSLGRSSEHVKINSSTLATKSLIAKAIYPHTLKLRMQLC